MKQSFRTALPEMKEGIVKRTVREMISDKLASFIASGVLSLGDELPSERDLAAALSVSRESVRSAIQDLASRGLLEISHGNRTRVISDKGVVPGQTIVSPRAVNDYDLRSVHEARMLVEGAVIADAAEHVSAATLFKLEASLAVQRQCLDDPVRFLIADREFHFTIYQACSNPLLADFVTGLYNYLMDQRRAAVSEPGAILRSFGDHREILAALRQGDTAAVIAAFDRHIDRIYKTTQRVLERAKAAKRASAVGQVRLAAQDPVGMHERQRARRRKISDKQASN